MKKFTLLIVLLSFILFSCESEVTMKCENTRDAILNHYEKVREAWRLYMTPELDKELTEQMIKELKQKAPECSSHILNP